MMKNLVSYFLNRPVVANAMLFGFILGAIILWQKMGKEEMPEFTTKWIRASIRYPGASAKDIELFITKPIEEKLKGVASLTEVKNTSSYGNSSFIIELESNLSNLQEKIQEVKGAIDAVDLPQEAYEPIYRQFRSSEKAIIDIGIYLKSKNILDFNSRTKLQKYALAFKNKILSLSEISGVEERGYLKPELQIKVIPELLEKYEISLNQVKNQIVSQNIRKPIGNMKDDGESEISIVSELNDIKSMGEVIVTSGFQGQKLKLSQLAKIENGFERANVITKIQGREGIILNIKKSSNADILTAQKAVISFVENFKRNHKDSLVDFVLIDDESYSLKNRLSLIGTNGLIGFILTLIVLFLFLDFRSGIWVAMGIPFALAFTIISTYILGYTINNMTLAAIIIVLGIVVDDAIIIAENISRRKREGNNFSATNSVLEVSSPILASVLTTCAAFIPLYFFSGTFGLFVKYIPAIIFFMLFASLLESFFILPAHLIHPLKIEKLFRKIFKGDSFNQKREKFLKRIEETYSHILQIILKHRFFVVSGFLLILGASLYIFYTKMNYMMFPREESRSFRLKVVAKKEVTKYQMARMVKPVEDIFLNDDRGIVTSVRTRIGQGHRGGKVKENEASLRVEIVPPSERKISLNNLLKGWGEKTKKLKGFEKISFQKGWFGSSSGSPIVVQIQENNDTNRNKIIERLKESLESMQDLAHIEVEKPITKQEYRLEIDKKETSRLGIDFRQLSTALRAYVEGDILYTLNSGEEEVDVRFTGNDESKNDIEKFINLTVANKDNYLVPIKNLVTVIKRNKPSNIQRINYKRAAKVYANLSKTTKKTPLEIADYLEKIIFPRILKGLPTTNLQLKGEVERSRKSQSDFTLSIWFVVCIIYILLIFLFNSFWTPLLVGAIIPFGIVGTILAFWIHGMVHYGFFAVVGTLGMIGIVINDSIILINKLEAQIKNSKDLSGDLFQSISKISATRLRAIVITTVTTVISLLPTAYGFAGYDSMLAEMMLAMIWGLLFGMFITLTLVPCIYSFYVQFKLKKVEVLT